MPAGKADLYIEQGSSFSVRVTLKDDAGNLRDLTGRTFTGQIRQSPTSSRLLASFTFNLLDQTTMSTRGQIDVMLTSLDTAAIPCIGGQTFGSTDRILSEYFYDIYSTTGVADDIRELEGTAQISPAVTR